MTKIKLFLTRNSIKTSTLIQLHVVIVVFVVLLLLFLILLWLVFRRAAFVFRRAAFVFLERLHELLHVALSGGRHSVRIDGQLRHHRTQLSRL
jgi:hypothetical protein